ncbi:7956_t:CDS:2, partial [Paraglomus occultum]
DVSVISSNNIGLDQEEPTESTETSVDDSELAKLSENKGSDLAMDEMPAEPQTTPETAPDQTSAPDPNANLEGDQPNTKVLPIEAKLLQRNRPRKSSLSPKVDLKIIVPPRETTVRRKPVQDKPSHPTRGRFNTLRKDLYLVFRFFCRLSMRTDTGGNIQMEEISIRGRALVLELILSMLDNSGPVFQVEDAYISLIRQALCVSLSQNGVSSNEQLFELSLSIFLMLFRLYRAPLKKELEVLFAEIYLRFLDMSNATYKQKQMVLQGLMKICSNPQSLVDVYLNYDCDLSMTSVFEKTVNTLSRVAQGRSKNVSGSAMGSIIGAHASGLLLDNKADLVALQEKKLKVRGLKCLVTIVRSLVEWCKDLDNKETGISQPEKAKPPETAEDKTTIIFSKNPLLNISMKEFSTAHGNNSNISIGLSDSEDNPAQYQEIMTRKQTLQTGIRLFNTKPQKGIDFFINHDFLKNDTQSIVSFFASTPGLSKAAIGEYLGESDPEAIKIMYAFVDSLDFKGLQFVDALRTFLQTFRLPGESQKIDRIMEKFADRYCENNPDVFANADTAYILAYSIIMLNTDQHSVQVKRRMDKSEFIKNNRGINNNNDLPDEFLGAIFDDIAVNEIVMEEEQISEVAKTAINIANERERQQMYDKEISQMQKKSQALLSSSRQDQKASIWRSATHSDHVKPMFVVACWPLMATLSVVFEESENISTTASKGNEFAQANSEAIELCLDGFMGAIRISSVFRMDVERDAFVSSLAKLTGLNHVDEMRSKNVAAIRTLLSAANAYGEGLQTSWLIVLKTISAMERYQLINSSGSVTYSAEDASGLDYSPQNQSTTGVINNHSSASAAVRNITRRGSLGGLMREFQSQSTIIAIDRIFTSSVKLSSDAIVHFVNALCTVSLEEVDASRTAPRMYSLQRIVEIAYYNMSRIRFEWTQIWKILQPHFNTVGCHPNNIVATFAIDSLRQLSMKFLERDELSHYNTQSEFMKPFEHIIRNNSSPAIRELIIHSLIQMISARAKNIKSGWKSIFIVFGRAAGDENPQLVDNAFGTVRLVYQKHLDLIGLSFGEFVNCLVEFAFNAKVEEIINESIRMMQGCVKLLVKDIEEGDKKNQNISSTFAASSPTTTSVTKKRLQHIEEEQFFFKWFPIVSGLSRLVIDHDSQVVRTKALDALFDILRNTGYLFETSYWSKILKNVIIPIFEDIKESTQLQLPTTGDFQRREATTEIWIQTIRLMVDLYTRFHDLFKDNSEYLLELLELFVALLKRKNEKLGQTGIRCFHNLIARNGSRFDSSTWGAVTDTLEQIFTATTPKELLELEITGVHENTDAKHTSQVIVGASNPVPDDITDTGAGVGGTSRRNQHNPPATPGKVDVDFPNAIIKCAAQLIIIQSVKDLALTHTVATPSSKDEMHYLAQMPAEYRNRWLRCLYNSYQFAHDFNANHELRHALFKSGYVQQMPNLTKQETLSLSVFLSILYDLYRTLGDDDSDLLPPLIEESTKVLERFITLLSADMMQNQQRDINNWSPLVITVLRELCATPWEESRGVHVPEFYRLSLKMIGVDRADVREYMQEFLEKIGNEFLNPDRWDV